MALKNRFEAPGSDGYKNNWFKKKFLEPAWVLYSKAQKELTAKSRTFLAGSLNQSLAWVKVLFRIGLILLCMVVFHAAAKVFASK